MTLKNLRSNGARILVVDDTPMSLNQFRGLLRSSGITADMASNGYEALSMAAGNVYDIIFIDYLMPDMDGTQTLHSIKSMSENKNSNTPCIVISGNADADNADAWMESGFDDWLAKPVKADLLCDILVKYIPSGKLYDASLAEENLRDASLQYPENLPDYYKAYSAIEDIDAQKAVENCGGVEELEDILETFSVTGKDTADRIEYAHRNGDISGYTILVHALKSSSRLVGAYKLGDEAEALENAGAKGDIDYINANSASAVEKYRRLSSQIGEALKEGKETPEDSSLPEISEKRLNGAYEAIYELVTADDFDSARGVSNALSGYRIPPSEKEFVNKINLMLARVDRDGIRTLIESR